ncbi:NADPH:quinone reductase [Virgisporangium ochraceum]|uniref:NADPH:quinone reductase n=2 Tax=Virgisporangium ochraceum TaxID=65505 RepID=A0A8J3ZZ41_9ACTN|nr:NADPH:quinone reductase [Virgisporangium ochraceum]
MVLHAFDGPDRFREEQLDRPSPAPTEILVRVAAAGLNPVEWNASAGGWIAALHNGPPLRLGWDVAGHVADVGYGVTHLKPGDAVFGMPRFPHPAGSYAEYVTGPSRHFARVPAGMPLVEAAGLPLAGLTAWQALVDVAAVSAGQRVLVTAAAGGVGHLAVQIAKARGAFVVGTARAENHGFLRTLGVDHPVDYTTTDLSTVDPVDIVVDLVSSSGIRLREGGVHISVAGPREDGVELLVEPDVTGLRGLADLVGRGLLRVHVDEVFPFDKVVEAHDRGRTGRTRGKLVLSLATISD